MLVDSHCHLDFPDFAEQRDALVARAVAAGVGKMVTICTRPRQEPDVRAIAEAYDQVYYAAGLHPLHAHEEPHPGLEAILTWSNHPKFVAVGEAGLDYHYQAETKATQIETFLLQIEAARQTKLPLVIHSRDADEDMADILTREHAAGAFSCVMHCFTAGPRLAETALSLGFYLSMSGVLTFKNSTKLREIFAEAPVDRILVETDAPYLAPTPHRGKRNEPAYVVETAKTGAALFALSEADFAAQTTENFHRLFWKAA